MKIKFLSLLLILATIIVISGCVDEEAQGFNCKATEDLARTIFFPYVGLLDHVGEIPGQHPHEFPQDKFNSGPESMPTLRDATSLLDRNIEKAETISLKLKAGIERYKAEGKDVSRLETLLEEYNRLIKEAKQYRALANATLSEENNSSITNLSQYNNSSSENMEVDYLIQSQKSMMQANNVLRDIFEELNSLMGSEELNNTSRLTSAGEGKAILMGSFTLNMHLENGDMIIMGLSRNSEIDINGNYTFEENTDMHDTVRLYHINSADVKISGSRKTVMLNTENVTLTADGEGYVAFQGDGTYSIVEAGKTIKEDEWAKPFFEEGMNPQEYGPDGKHNNTGNGPDNNDNDIVEQTPDNNDKDIVGQVPDNNDNDIVGQRKGMK
ncbi:hypothetical protein [Methanosarcina barkeri]|uniref:ATPase involved in DNA repair n=3 Tax=Methanosarcina TaxID=2207 RepID=A0A0E3QU54_METBA|nr:hypothetical protein [Methanosarcina barkeri]AKB54174.1 hypothetical protein MSBRM_1176 [Methanosarcina barkeri MS]AKB57751.1 hypothetical protein MSBR2_1235 [Methanosarcina barkeri 227]